MCWTSVKQCKILQIKRASVYVVSVFFFLTHHVIWILEKESYRPCFLLLPPGLYSSFFSSVGVQRWKTNKNLRTTLRLQRWKACFDCAPDSRWQTLAATSQVESNLTQFFYFLFVFLPFYQTTLTPCFWKDRDLADNLHLLQALFAPGSKLLSIMTCCFFSPQPSGENFAYLSRLLFPPGWHVFFFVVFFLIPASKNKDSVTDARDLV